MGRRLAQLVTSSGGSTGFLVDTQLITGVHIKFLIYPTFMQFLGYGHGITKGV